MSMLAVAACATSCAGLTHLGVPVDDHVRLVSLSAASQSGDVFFVRIRRDGSTENPWFVPRDRILVLTDFQYSAINDVPGRSGQCPIYRVHGIFNPVYIPLITLGGIAGTYTTVNPIVSHVSLTSGVIIDSTDGIVANAIACGPNARLTLLGYLIDAPTQ
jgi:hypothetical protein